MASKQRGDRRVRKASPELQQVARDLRRMLTPAEEKLWQALRAGRLGGLKFRRQHPVDRFILDFYCAECKLVVEVDGDHHRQQHERDVIRTQYLEGYGCRILRFTNAEVIDELDDVLGRILTSARTLSSG